MKIHKLRIKHVRAAESGMTRYNPVSCDLTKGEENRTVAGRNLLYLKKKFRKLPPIHLFQHKLDVISTNSSCFVCKFATESMLNGQSGGGRRAGGGERGVGRSLLSAPEPALWVQHPELLGRGHAQHAVRF